MMLLMLAHIKRFFFFGFLFFSFEVESKEKYLPFLVKDETAEKSIVVSRTLKGEISNYTFLSNERTLCFSTEHTFAGAFIPESKEKKYACLMPLQKRDCQQIAFICLDTARYWVFDFKKLLINYELIPVTKLYSNGKVFEYWNLEEWSLFENTLKVACRVSINEEKRGTVGFDFEKEQLVFFDYKKQHGPQSRFGLTHGLVKLIEAGTLSDKKERGKRKAKLSIREL